MTPELIAFNRGRISPLGLARTDFKRTALSAEVMTNWIPRTLGAMSIRPGMEFTGSTRSNNKSITIPFIKSNSDTARLEITNGKMRVWVDDDLISRPSVSAAVTNGNFDTDITGWTDVDAGGSVSAWVTGGYMSLVGTITSSARRRQEVTVTETGTAHALAVVVERGPVTIRVGSSSGGDQYVSETTLGTGTHNLAFTPSGNFWVEVFNYSRAAALISSITVASSGVLEVDTPWMEDDLPMLRWDQSGDVLFVACAGYQQRRIERRSNNSWSIVLYQSGNGPFRVLNTGPTTIAPSDTVGDVTLTSSAPMFKESQVGSLFKITQSGQSVDVELTGGDQWSEPIRVSGVGGTRNFGIIINGTFVATIHIQYSVGSPGVWLDAVTGPYTSPRSASWSDGLDNQIIYYRIGIKSGNYTSGLATALLTYSSGSQTGIARVTGYTNTTTVSASVLVAFGNTTASSDWYEGMWSPYRGWPSSVGLYEGRLWWAGKDRIQGSVSDDFANFDPDTTGDSAPISRSIGSGPVDTIHWLLPLQRLVLGADAEIRTARSSSFDEPLTVSNFNLKGISTDGSQSIAAVKVGTSGIYVSGTRFFETAYDGNSSDYGVSEISQIIPEIGEPGVSRIAIQTKPEKRLHAVRTDGTVALMVYDKQEDVTCWVDIETSGIVEDAVVIPGTGEDNVYYTVRRVIDGQTVRYHEKWAIEAECRGIPESKLADSFLQYSGAASTTITGLDHLEGEDVVCWGWNTVTPFVNSDGAAIGKDMGIFTVTGGEINGLGDAVTDAVIGLGYTARFKSSKLSYVVQSGTMLCQKKNIGQIGVIARWIHADGLRYGPDFDTLDAMPMVEKAAVIDGDDLRIAYDEEMFPFNGEWDTDARICLEATAPRPVTLLAVVAGVDVNTK